MRSDLPFTVKDLSGPYTEKLERAMGIEPTSVRRQVIGFESFEVPVGVH